jgi:hypothetical protein
MRVQRVDVQSVQIRQRGCAGLLVACAVAVHPSRSTARRAARDKPVPLFA